jgi:hypothetical protein
MADYITVKFITAIQTIEHSMPSSIITDLKTNEPYKYAMVHGKTWQTRFYSEMPEDEAFTPCPFPYNHRGIYEWCPEEKAYKLNLSHIMTQSLYVKE